MQAPDTTTGVGWFKAEKGAAHTYAVAAFRRLDQAQAYRKERNLKNMRASGLRVFSLGPDGYAKRPADDELQPRYNCIEAAIDALVSHIGSNKPSPYFLTDGDSYRAQKQAEVCTKAVVGQFYQAGTYTLLRRMLADSLRLDCGVIKSVVEYGEVVDKAVFPNDLLIDDVDAYHGRYRQVLEIEYRDREEVIDEIEDRKDLSREEKDGKIGAVRGAGLIRGDSFVSNSGIADPVAVLHAYYLPWREGKKGRFVRCVENCDLEDKEWKHTWSPYTIHVWMEQTQGVFGKGFAEQAGGAQRRLDANMRKIACLTTLGTMKLYVDRFMQINDADLNNDNLGIIKGNGPNPPKLIGTLAIPGELFQQNEWLRNSIYEMAGISQLMLSAKVQPGMESAVGVRAVADQQAGRFRKASDALDETAMELARKHIALSMEIPGYKVMAQDEDHSFEVAWKDLDQEVLKRRIKVWPTNLMQGSPAMQIEMAERIAKLGIVTPRALLRMVKVKDVERQTSLLTASERLMERLIDRMLDDENPVYKGPERFMDLEGALTMCQYAYLDAQTRDVPQRNLDMLADFMLAADEMNKEKLAKVAEVQAQAQLNAQAAAMQQAAPPTQAA